MTIEEIHWYEWGLYNHTWESLNKDWDVVRITQLVRDFLTGNGAGFGGGSIGGAGLPLGVGIIDPTISAAQSGRVGYTKITGDMIFGKNLTKLESKQFISLVCKINGITIEQVKQRKNSELTLLEITKTIDTVLGTNVVLKSIG